MLTLSLAFTEQKIVYCEIHYMMGIQKNNKIRYKNLTVNTEVFSEAKGYALSKFIPSLLTVSR